MYTTYYLYIIIICAWFFCATKIGKYGSDKIVCIISGY